MALDKNQALQNFATKIATQIASGHAVTRTLIVRQWEENSLNVPQPHTEPAKLQILVQRAYHQQTGQQPEVFSSAAGYILLDPKSTQANQEASEIVNQALIRRQASINSNKIRRLLP